MLIKLAIFFFLSFLLKKKAEEKEKEVANLVVTNFLVPKIMNHPNFSFLGCWLQLIVRKDGIHIKEILKKRNNCRVEL